MRPASATVFSSSVSERSTPGSPRRANPGALRRGEASAALPSPPRPPWAATNLVPVPIRSASTSPSSVVTTVPSGTRTTRSAPRPPVQVQQGGGTGVDLQDHVAAAAAVPAIRAAQRLELLPPDRGTAVPAIARLHPQRYLVGELRHCFLPSGWPRTSRSVTGAGLPPGRVRGGPAGGPPLTFGLDVVLGGTYFAAG